MSPDMRRLDPQRLDPQRLDPQRLAATYGPMLDALQQALDEAVDSLSWDERSDAREVTLHGGGRALRVGSIHALGVPTAQLDLTRISRAVNDVLARHGFPEQPPISGSPSGNLLCTSTDAGGAELTVMIKSEISAWVDLSL